MTVSDQTELTCLHPKKRFSRQLPLSVIEWQCVSCDAFIYEDVNEAIDNLDYQELTKDLIRLNNKLYQQEELEKDHGLHDNEINEWRDSFGQETT